MGASERLGDAPIGQPAETTRDWITVERARPGDRLDTFLKEHYPTLSRGRIQRLIAAGHVRVAGHAVKASHTPRVGERIEIGWPEARPCAAEPEAITLEILYEDACLLVLNKAAEMVVHPAAGHASGTLVNALLHHCAGQLSGIGGVARPGIVHRLDKGTSGCLVVAKDDATHLALAAQFARRQVRKVYDAIVCGSLSPARGEIRAAIARHPSHRKRMAVSGGGRGREALTTYRVIEPLCGATWVEAVLHTGRTHQIRVHFHHIGHPLVGDATYGKRQNSKLTAVSEFAAKRQMLHARSLAIIHPGSGRELSFEAPRPADYEEALARLRRGAGDLNSLR